MRLNAQLQSTIEILTEIDTNPKPADYLCNKYFRARRYIGSKDRHNIAKQVYGVLRNRAKCDWGALQYGLSPHLLSPSMAARIRLIFYLWKCDQIPPIKIKEFFNGDKYAPQPLDLREQKLFKQSISFSSIPLWVICEIPEWLYSSLKRRFPKSLESELKVFKEQAPTDLRVNILKATQTEVQELLTAQNILTTPTSTAKYGLRCQERVPITTTKIFQKGLIEIQDEGSQILMEKLLPKAGDTVLDLCAGAGGKSLAMSSLMQNKGKIIATDIASWRLQRTRERMRRAGAHNIELRTIKNLQDQWLKRQKERFDIVLVDAPCSGSGTWRRNPDQKWRLKPKDLIELTHLQKELLDTAAPLIKPEGRLLYVTCSLLCEENEDVITSFLQKNPNFTPQPNFGFNKQSFMHLTPNKNQTDGFFGACLIKSNNAK